MEPNTQKENSELEPVDVSVWLDFETDYLPTTSIATTIFAKNIQTIALVNPDVTIADMLVFTEVYAKMLVYFNETLRSRMQDIKYVNYQKEYIELVYAMVKSKIAEITNPIYSLAFEANVRDMRTRQIMYKIIVYALDYMLLKCCEFDDTVDWIKLMDSDEDILDNIKKYCK